MAFLSGPFCFQPTTSIWCSTLTMGLWVLLTPNLASAKHHIQLQLYDHPVDCQAEQCFDPETGRIVEGEFYDVPLLITKQTAALGDVRLYLRLNRAQEGVQAAIEIIIPSEKMQPQVTFREYRQGQITFTATTVSGRIVLPATLLGLTGETCSCDGGLLELLCRDHGPDEIADTADDAFRHLRWGVISDATGDFCRPPEMLNFNQDTLSASPNYWCSPPPVQDPPEEDFFQDDPVIEVDPGVGCLIEDPDRDPYYDEEGGCGGEEPDENWDDGGCEGDGSSDADYESGCEGSYEDSESMDCESGGDGDFEGCEGDSSSADCVGDAQAAIRPSGRERSPGRLRANPLVRHLGALSPFFIFSAFVIITRRLRR